MDTPAHLSGEPKCFWGWPPGGTCALVTGDHEGNPGDRRPLRQYGRFPVAVVDFGRNPPPSRFDWADERAQGGRG